MFMLGMSRYFLLSENLQEFPIHQHLFVGVQAQMFEPLKYHRSGARSS